MVRNTDGLLVLFACNCVGTMTDWIDRCCVFNGDSLYRMESVQFTQPVLVVTTTWWNS